MYPNRICNNFGQFGGWTFAIKNMILWALNSGRSSTNHNFGETCDILRYHRLSEMSFSTDYRNIGTVETPVIASP